MWSPLTRLVLEEVRVDPHGALHRSVVHDLGLDGLRGPEAVVALTVVLVVLVGDIVASLTCAQAKGSVLLHLGARLQLPCVQNTFRHGIKENSLGAGVCVRVCVRTRVCV